jgi:hypothetical protein
MHASFSIKTASTKQKEAGKRKANNHLFLTKTTKTMKTQDYKKWTRALLVLLLSFGFTGLNRAEANPFPGVSFQVFYDELAPYGDWVMDPNQGYIWLPYAEQGFHPYGSNGHWAMTSYGNTWVSYYDWGWAPFHYGRWYFDNYYQSWAWVPGYEWGPAWVNWRTGGGYYGWAPLAPGFSINVAVNLPSFYFVFIPRNRIYHHYAHRYYAPYGNRVRIYNNTTIINNTVVYNNNRYVAGPNRREIERVTRRTVPVYQVQASDRAGRAAVSRNSISLYRPELENGRSRNVEARPTRVLDANEARSARSQSADRSISNGTRTANPIAGNASEPSSRSDRTVRSSAPAQESRSFETRPFEDSRSRTSTPSREIQARTQIGTNGSRSSSPTSGRTSPTVQQREQTRTQPSQSTVRTNQRQPSQSSRPEAKPAQTQRSQSPQSSVRSAPQQRSSPEVRSSSRTAPANSRVSTTSSSQKSGSSRVSTAPKKESSSSSTSRSTSSRTVKPKGN